MHLIVGVDTGKTIAYACIGLDGRLVSSGHLASGGPEWLISAVEKIGIPSIVACDKMPNHTAAKISAAFRSRLFSPEKELSILQKREMAKPFGITNPHERDACAAAVKAYNAYANKLKQAEHIARNEGRNVMEIDAIQAKVIERYSIDEALSNRAANRR